MCVCVYTHTCSSQCRDAGRAKEIKEKKWDRVNAACRGFVSRGMEPLFAGRDGSVGIATRYGLDGTGIESLWELGPGSNAVACTMGTGSLSRE